MAKICYVATVPITIEAFFMSQLQYLASKKYEVTVICSYSDTLQKQLGNDIRYVPMDIPRGITVSGSVLAIKSLTRFFKKEKFDLIQYSTPNAAFYASIAAKRAGIQIRNYHLMGFRFLGANGLGRFILKILEKITCHSSTTIECVSRSNLEIGVKERIFSEKKATIIWNGSTGGVDLKRFDYTKRRKWRQEIRTELGYTEKDFVYGFAGRITYDKGMNEILGAFFSLEDDSKLFLIGNLEGEKTLDQELWRVAQIDDRVKIHESVTDIERYYAAMDVLLLPSYREGFGNVIIEAGAVGTPAIVSNIPGPIDAIIENETALVVPVKNTEALMNAMRRIRTLNSDQMGENAKEFVKEAFDSDKLNEYILKRKNFLVKTYLPNKRV